MRTTELLPTRPAAGASERRDHAPCAPSPATFLFEQQRPRLLAIAYRVVGSPREAEDVVQDAFIRWSRVDVATVENPSAFLTRMVTRLAINVVKSAHHRRVDYLGLAVPDSVGAPAFAPDAAVAFEAREELATAIALVAERLTPAERAVFLLHECLGFSYAEIAPIVGKTEENCRQIEHRARRHLREARRPRAVERARHSALLERFLLAAREGEMAALVELLAGDVAATRRPKSVSRHTLQ